MSDIEPQPITVRLEDGEIDESSELLEPTSLSPVMHQATLSPKRENDGNYDEIAVVLAKLGEGDSNERKNPPYIPKSSSQVYPNDEESDIIDEDEMICVRGASPLPLVVDRRNLTRKCPPCDGDDFNIEMITPQKRRKTSSKRRRKNRSTPKNIFGEKSMSSEDDRKDSKEGSQSPSTTPQKLDQLCKFYLQDVCAKGRSCEYMHSEFPCKFYYTDVRCDDMENTGRCKLSHNGPLSKNMMMSLIRHLHTAPIELLGEKFTDLRAKIAPGDFSMMIHQMHEKLLSQAEESETGTANSEPNIIAIMRERLSYFLSNEQLDKLIQLRVSKCEDLLSLTLAQLNGIGISAIQIEAIQLTILSSQDVDMRCLYPQCVAKSAELNEDVLPAGDVDLRKSKWEEEDELPLVIDESYEVEEKQIKDDEDDIVIDVVGDKTPPFVCCGSSKAIDEENYSNASEVIICAAIDPLLDIAEQYHSDNPVTPSPDNTIIEDPVLPKCDTAQEDIEISFKNENENEMSVKEGEECYTPPPREKEEIYTPPPKQEEESYTPPAREKEESYTPPPKEEEKSYTSPPKEEEESYTSPPKEEEESYTPPSKEVKQRSPSPLKELDSLDQSNEPKEHVKQPKEHINAFKEDVKEPNEQVHKPIVTSIRPRRSTRFIDPNIMDLEPLDYRDERKLPSNRHRRPKRTSVVDLDHWKYRNESKETQNGNSDGRREETWDEVPRRQYQKQVDRQMEDNNSSEDWDAEEQDETVAASKPKETSATEIICIDSPDNSDNGTATIFPNSNCPDLPRRLPNLDNYKPALEIDAHLTYPAMEYKLYEIFLPNYEVNKPTLMDKLVKANSSDPRLKKFLEKEKNYGFLPQTDYSFFPPNSNSHCDPRHRPGYVNACPEPNYNSSPILYGYLQRSLWYQELKSNLKIQINHSVSDLVRALNAFHKDPTPNKIFDLFQIECAGVLLEVMQNVGIFIDAHGSIIELSNYQHLCAAPQHPIHLTSQSYNKNNNYGNNCSGAGPPLKPGLLGYAPSGMYPHPPMTPQNNEKSFMQQAFGNDYPQDCNNNNNGVQPSESGFYVRERNFNRNCGGDGYCGGGGAGVGGGVPSGFKQSRSHYRRPQKKNFNRRM